MILKNILAVGLGSAIGGILRYLVYIGILPELTSHYKTLIINIIGCLVFGVLYGLAHKLDFHSKPLFLFLTIGLCGGFTTFSTFAFDNFSFLRQGEILASALYISASVFFCILATFLGYKLITSLF